MDPQRFFDYYTLRDWQGDAGSITTPEKWQAILRLWGSNGRDKTKQTDKPGGSFDTDAFFEASLRQSYGELADEIINGG